MLFGEKRGEGVKTLTLNMMVRVSRKLVQDDKMRTTTDNDSRVIRTWKNKKKNSS